MRKAVIIITLVTLIASILGSGLAIIFYGNEPQSTTNTPTISAE